MALCSPAPSPRPAHRPRPTSAHPPTKFTHAKHTHTHPVYPSAAGPLRHFPAGCPTLIAAARSTQHAARSTPRSALPQPQTPSLANRSRLLTLKQRRRNIMRQLQQTFPLHAQNQAQCTCPSPGAKRTICPRTLGTWPWHQSFLRLPCATTTLQSCPKVDVDGLLVRVRLQSRLAKLSSNPALLHTSKRNSEIRVVA
jgi:hypothetical protein